MKAILYILLGLSLGSGLTLIALQERFIRERRRLLAMGESQRAKSAQAEVAALNKQWEQKCQQQADELHECQARLDAAAAVEPSPSSISDDFIDRTEHDRLIDEKNSELSRLAAEIKTIGSHLANHQVEVSDLQGQITFLKGEIARLEEEKKQIPNDDFLVLAQSGGHLLPGSVVRAFIKGHQDRQ